MRNQFREEETPGQPSAPRAGPLPFDLAAENAPTVAGDGTGGVEAGRVADALRSSRQTHLTRKGGEQVSHEAFGERIDGSAVRAWWNENWVNNPMVMREKRVQQTQRERTSTLMRVIGNTLGILVIGAVYLGIGALCFTGRPTDVHGAFLGLLLLQSLFLALMGPSQTATLITQEREKQTWNALLLSRLTPSQIIVGKLLASLSPVIGVMAIFLPLNILTAIVGHVGFGGFLLAHFTLIATVFASTVIGLHASWSHKRTAAANSQATGSLAALLFVTPGIAGLISVLPSIFHIASPLPGLASTLPMWLNPIFAQLAAMPWPGETHPLEPIRIVATMIYLAAALGTGFGLSRHMIKNLWRAPKDFTG